MNGYDVLEYMNVFYCCVSTGSRIEQSAFGPSTYVDTK